MSDPRDLTTWEPLKLIFKELLVTDALFFPADPSKELQRYLLKFLTDKFEEEVREHTWTGFEMDCVRWAKLGEVLDRNKE